jgi:hypothetical protein
MLIRWLDLHWEGPPRGSQAFQRRRTRAASRFPPRSLLYQVPRLSTPAVSPPPNRLRNLYVGTVTRL